MAPIDPSDYCGDDHDDDDIFDRVLDDDDFIDELIDHDDGAGLVDN